MCFNYQATIKMFWNQVTAIVAVSLHLRVAVLLDLRSFPAKNAQNNLELVSICWYLTDLHIMLAEIGYFDMFFMALGL